MSDEGDGGGLFDGSTSTSPRPVRFVALGDTGMGNDVQRSVADAVAAVCAARGCAFAVGLGDLIYPGGASSANDPQFEEKFEEPYADLTLPFWNVLGNHDNGADPLGTGLGDGLGLWYDTGNNEVAYSQRTDRMSDKWHLPERHYAAIPTAANVPVLASVHLVALDTNTMIFYGVPTSTNPATIVAQLQAQEAWLDSDAFAADAAWTVALGHHPYISNGPHGNAGNFDDLPLPGLSGDHFKEVFETHCDKIDLYLAGHDHNLQWLKPNAACPTTEFIVSGGGGADTYEVSGSNPARFEAESHGFWWIELGVDTLRAAAFDAEAELLFEQIITRVP